MVLHKLIYIYIFIYLIYAYNYSGGNTVGNTISGSGIDILTNFGHAFNKEEYSDLKLIVDHKPIYVSKLILKIQNDHLYMSLSHHWKDKDCTEIKLDGYSYEAYCSFLYFLYSGEVKVEPNFTGELLALAKMYTQNNLFELSLIASEKIMLVDNIVELYTSAVEHRVTELEDKCLKFIFTKSSLVEVLKSEGFYNAGSHIVKQIFMKAVEGKLM